MMPHITYFTTVIKRDLRQVPWDSSHMVTAIFRAMQDRQFCEPDPNMSKVIAESVAYRAIYILERDMDGVTTVHIEHIQDAIEETLVVMDLYHTAKSFILFRQKRMEERKVATPLTLEDKARIARVQSLVTQSKAYFTSPLSEFIYFRSYSRWIEEEHRRETWVETVGRYMAFMKEKMGEKITPTEYTNVHAAILNMDVMPSMRLMWAAGDFARTNPAAGYNCSFIAPICWQDFAEVMFLSMSGCGVGFSCEAEYVNQLPQIKKVLNQPKFPRWIDDTREGWCDALVYGMEAWAHGADVEWDFSRIRPAGARLKTTGGRSSGHEPLRHCLHFVRDRIRSRAGRRLRPIDVHDIVCMIGEISNMSDVRRTALISLSDLDDHELATCKNGDFYRTHPFRSNANNSAMYYQKPSSAEFMREWTNLALSGTGERGIQNFGDIQAQIPARRDGGLVRGSNPCNEIYLRNKQKCNLTEVVARPDDDLPTLENKVYIATVLGTYQSTLTDFAYLSPEWKKNCDEERLLGVSITGAMDCKAILENAQVGGRGNLLTHLRKLATEVNIAYAERFGINQSAAITCCKPSGTVSQLVGSSSGIHPRHSQFYIRRVRISATDPLFLMLKSQGFPYYPEVGSEPGKPVDTYVLEFPVESPKDAVLRKHMTGIDQLGNWLKFKTNWTDHNPSATISLKDEEWMTAGAWVYDHWEQIGGLSFLPYSNHGYELAPYEAVDEAYYRKVVENTPKVDFAKILDFEREDHTIGSQELACSAGKCEL